MHLQIIFKFIKLFFCVYENKHGAIELVEQDTVVVGGAGGASLPLPLSPRCRSAKSHGPWLTAVQVFSSEIT